MLRIIESISNPLCNDESAKVAEIIHTSSKKFEKKNKKKDFHVTKRQTFQQNIKEVQLSLLRKYYGR